MSDELTYYLAFNNGLSVSRAKSGKMTDERFFFEGRTLEHLTGCLETPEVVFAAVAFDGGYRTEDGGRSWQKIIDGSCGEFGVVENYYLEIPTIRFGSNNFSPLH